MILFTEDDCSPDAREYFGKSLKEKTGFDLFEFKNNLKTIYFSSDGGFYTVWINDGFALIISADDPYYELHEIDEDFKSKIIGHLNVVIKSINEM